MIDNQRTVENLHHFSCSACQKWWTIGDAPSDKVGWFCPWCGVKNNYDINQAN